MHIKKNLMPRTWPVPRKAQGKKYVSVPSHATSKGISLLFILRDILKIARTKKEVRFMTLNGLVKVNNKVRKDENFPVQFLDTINLEKSGENYRLEIVNRKFSLKEISEKEASEKIVKIAGKKILGAGKTQMNLDDGQNIFVGEKFSVGDSALIDTVNQKILKILPLTEGANIEVVLGKHAGESQGWKLGQKLLFEERKLLRLLKNFFLRLIILLRKNRFKIISFLLGFMNILRFRGLNILEKLELWDSKLRLFFLGLEKSLKRER
jgi:small subunit ribosomal protein S4e